MAGRAVLKEIENNRQITAEQETQFTLVLQRALLLALMDMEILTEAQCRWAEQKLCAGRSEESTVHNKLISVR